LSVVIGQLYQYADSNNDKRPIVSDSSWF
jgi:hypothetical protein